MAKKLTAKQELDEAQAKVQEARLEESKAKDKYRKEVLEPKLRKMIGNCYYYMNSYGGNSKPWRLYAKILNINDDLDLIVERFQKTENNSIEFEVREELTYFHIPFENDGSWIKCTQATYSKARNKLLGILEERGSY